MKRKREEINIHLDEENEAIIEELERSSKEPLFIQERKEREDKDRQEYEDSEKYSALYTNMQEIKNTDPNVQLNIEDLPSPNNEMSCVDQK